MAPRILVVGYDWNSTRTLAKEVQDLGAEVTTGSAEPMPDPADAVLIVVDAPRAFEKQAMEAARQAQNRYCVPAILVMSTPGENRAERPDAVITISKPIPHEWLQNIIAIAGVPANRRCLESGIASRHSFRMLKEAQSLAKIGHWEHDLGTEESFVSEECFHLHGLERPAGSASVDDLLAHVLPDDRERVTKLWFRAAEECLPYNTEYRVSDNKDPRPRILRQDTIVQCDEKGRPSRLFSIVRDITEQRSTEDALRESEQRASQLLKERDFILENTRDVLYYIDRDWSIYYISPSIEQITGFTVDEWHGPFVAHLADTPNNRRAILETMEILRTGRTYPPTDIDIPHKNGSLLTAEVNEKPIVSGGQVVGIVGVARDVTEKRHAEHRLRQGTAVFDNMLEAVMITDAERRITAVNRSFTEVTGYTEVEAHGRDPDFLRAGPDEDAAREKAWDKVAQHDRWGGELWSRRKSGEVFPAWMALSTIRGQTGVITNYVCVFSDLSRIRESEEKLERLAHYDPLTHLPNRLLFQSRLAHALRAAERQRQEVAVLFIDLDHFKTVNDTLGHPAGDRLLQQVSRRLDSILRKEDTIAHLGGDEFVVILEDFADLRHLANIAQKVLDSLRQPYPIDGHEATLTASVGISIYPRDGTDVTTLVQNADAAMYRAKELGRAKFQFYTAELTTKAIERMTLTNALRKALKKHEFILFYQPQLSLDSGRIVGVEALVRWLHPERGLTQPTSFIPLEEETGLITELGEWVLRAACLQARAWETTGTAAVRMAVNVSAMQVSAEVGLVERIRRILRETGMPPSRLELEITESAIMRNPQEASVLLRELKGLGIRLAIDDFGTGYSSMSYLKTFAVDRLKVDASFIHDLPSDTHDIAIVRAIIALGHTLDMKVLAEGVETSEQRSFLRDNGCDEMQGYLISPPMPEAQCRLLLASMGTE